jgi:hypothetical protein
MAQSDAIQRRRDVEESEHLIEHLAVLDCRADGRAQRSVVLGDFCDNGRHFDRFGPRADHTRTVGIHQPRPVLVTTACPNGSRCTVSLRGERYARAAIASISAWVRADQVFASAVRRTSAR